MQRQRQSARSDRVENLVDTVTVGLADRYPDHHGQRVLGEPGCHPHGPRPDFDFAYDIQGEPATGTSVILPRAALGIVSSGSAEPGVLPRTDTFDEIEAAPSNGYITEEAVPIALGNVYIVRSRDSVQHRRANLRQGRGHRPRGQFAHPQGPGATRIAVTGSSCPASPTADTLVIDLKRLRQDPEGSRASLLRRRDPTRGRSLDALLGLDRERRDILVRVEAIKADRNAASQDVARRKRAGEPADDLMARAQGLGRGSEGAGWPAPRGRGRAGAARPRAAELPGGGVADGDASANRVVRTWGTPPTFDFQPKPHWELLRRWGCSTCRRVPS